MNNMQLINNTFRRSKGIMIISLLYLISMLTWVGMTGSFQTLMLHDWVLLSFFAFLFCGSLFYGVFEYRSAILLNRHREKLQSDSDHMLHSLFEFNPQAIAVINRKGQFVQANTAARRLSGYTVDELQQASFDNIILDDERKKVYVYSQQAFKGIPQTFETAILHMGGYRIDLNVTVVPIRGLTEEIQSLLVIFEDITTSKRALERIKYMAYYDDMTGIPNRRFFKDHLESALHLASYNNSKLAVFFLDIDRFKLFNDSFGHDVGNMLLMQVAERLMHCVTEHDVIARMEGDEFAIFYTDAGQTEDIVQLTNNIYEQLEMPFECQGYNLHLTVSIGISINTEKTMNADMLMRNADIALSKAKEVGRNTYQFYAASMERGMLDRLTLEADLRSAMQRNEFELYYQPQLDIRTGQIIGLESLLRWNHPTRGIVAPDVFIPTIEENGMIFPIGEKVIEWACRQNAEWQNAGLPKFPISVNLSVKQFLNPDLVDRIRDILDETRLDPSYLELEITETVTLDVDYIQIVLDKLQKLGVKICIDDFGMGYSSLHYLKRFPISRLKIDRSFVRDIMEDQNDAQIVQTIIAMAHHLNMSVVAEGVETIEQLYFLRNHDCMEIQGYLVSRPLPARSIEEWMRKWQPSQLYKTPSVSNLM